MPRAATSHFDFTVCRAMGVCQRRMCVGIFAIPVGCPFPGIADYVIQSESFRWETPHGRGKGKAIVILERMTGEARPVRCSVSIEGIGDAAQALRIIAIGVASRAACATRVFPLCFGR